MVCGDSTSVCVCVCVCACCRVNILQLTNPESAFCYCVWSPLRHLLFGKVTSSYFINELVSVIVSISSLPWLSTPVSSCLWTCVEHVGTPAVPPSHWCGAVGSPAGVGLWLLATGVGLWLLSTGVGLWLPATGVALWSNQCLQVYKIILL